MSLSQKKCTESEYKKCVELGKCIKIKHVEYIKNKELINLKEYEKKCDVHIKCLIKHERCDKTDFKNHAEYKCNLSNKNMSKTAIAIITIPPCGDCFNHIFINNKNIKIFCFIDDSWNKMGKRYLEKLNINKKIIIKKTSTFIDKNTMYNAYYIVMSYLGGCLSKELYGTPIKIAKEAEKIEKIAKELVDILKKEIDENSPSRDQIKIPEVWVMIENVNKINIDEIRHIYISGKNFKWIINNKDIGKNKTTKTNIPKTKTNIPKTKTNVKNDSKQKF